MSGDIENIPNSRNFCGGNFYDWLEVMLVSECNGCCSWCIEKGGFHPKDKVGWDVLAERIISSGKQNIILLGGEPTLYKNLSDLVDYLRERNRAVYITTNGSRLTPLFVESVLRGVKGLNISIHDYDLAKNFSITGISHSDPNLARAIECLHGQGAIVRLNCNLIRGHIDSVEKIEQYIEFAKAIGVDSIRFAELKLDRENFVDLFKLYGGRYGINNEPFGLGCNTDVKIADMPVNFRQMCGFQTTLRPYPINAKGRQKKQVLYYDGNFYDGWQKGIREMAEKTKEELEKENQELKEKIKQLEEAAGSQDSDSGYCQY